MNCGSYNALEHCLGGKKLCSRCAERFVYNVDAELMNLIEAKAGIKSGVDYVQGYYYQLIMGFW